jgi:serine/threonine protein kinase
MRADCVIREHAMGDETPRQLGRYELIRRIAVGGMGEIYLARVRGTAGFEKTVIIKTILPHLAEEETFVDKFLDEGRIVVNLTHGNIVPVFDMDEVDGEYFIAMDYVPGRDVREVLKRLRERGEQMPVDIATYITAEVCEGLGYAHRQTDEEGNNLGIVHRDVSPSNVLISTEGEVKIIDFGIARAADRRAKTVSGRIQGKCCYMSPEQARGDDLDHRSDVFSTGVVFYEMLTGLRPFEGDSDLKSLDLVRECDYEPPSFVDGEVPPQIDAIVERALQKDPDDRYQTIDEMHLELMEYLAEDGAPMTSTKVAEFLEDLFPEGLEREEFQRDEDDEPEPADEELGLDEALNRELERLDDAPDGPGGDDIDPFRETKPADQDDEADQSDTGSRPQIGPGSGRTETITPEARSAVDVDGGPTEDDRAQTPGSTPAPEPEQRVGNDTETAETADESGGGGGRGAILAVVALMVGIGLGAGAFWGFGGPDKAELSVRTEPAGASIRLDGQKVDGHQTPHEMRVTPGDHTLAFDKKGYRERMVDVSLEPGLQETLAVSLQKAEDESDEESAREFIVQSEPEGAKLRVNRQKVGQAPVAIEVAPGETKFIEARMKDCERAQLPVFHGRENKTVTVSLECGPPEEKDGGESDEKTAAAEDGDKSAGGAREQQVVRPRRIEVTFASEPAGATVWVDERQVGKTPVDETFRRGAELSVRFEKADYETVERTVSPTDLDGGRLEVAMEEKKSGCLNFFAVHPQYNELAIDGQWLEGRRQKLQHYELSAGKHTIRVRNPDAGRDETFEFDVDPGEDCTSLTVWDPDDG